jgi:hypothetical protein
VRLPNVPFPNSSPSNPLSALGIATACLFIRTVFRSVELSGGFSGHLANSQVQFMILDGVMVIVACTCLTVLHPGIGFGNKWAEAKFPFGKKAETNCEMKTREELVVSGEKISPTVKTSEQATPKVNASI